MIKDYVNFRYNYVGGSVTFVWLVACIIDINIDSLKILLSHELIYTNSDTNEKYNLSLRDNVDYNRLMKDYILDNI